MRVTILSILVMDIVMMKITIMAVTLMVVIVVDPTLIQHTVLNASVLINESCHVNLMIVTPISAQILYINNSNSSLDWSWNMSS